MQFLPVLTVLVHFGLGLPQTHLRPPYVIGQIITGSIARNASLPVFNLLRGRLRFFARQGRHVAPMGVKFGVEEGTFGLKVPSSTPNFTPIGATTKV